MTQQLETRERPSRKSNGALIRVWVNLAFFICMVVVLAPHATGIPIHEWASFLIIVPLFVHLVMDWKWIVSTTKRIFGRMPGERRFNYFLDWLLFFLFIVATLSGVLISEAALPALGIDIVIDPFWTELHDMSANTMVAVLGIHLAMHWKWIATNVNKYILRKTEKNSSSEGAG